MYRSSDHPRSRGVYSSARSGGASPPGSSPLARGLQGWRGHAPPGRGIIPARAGFTSRRPRRERGPPDHPRSRGVYSASITPNSSADGSSPLARGLPTAPHPAAPRLRIIPARAGFTVRCGLVAGERVDHPRSRGVYASRCALNSGMSGSSPLARGLPTGHTPAGWRMGIIPARAGFTRGRAWRWGQLTDHPRSRGVYEAAIQAGADTAGSSPLARGLPLRYGQQVRRRGIIPARAGFTGGAVTAPHPHGDHPRSRGVYVADLQSRVGGQGSSPLARGLRLRVRRHLGRDRIIPARAGFTPASRWTPRSATDHPRSRGVYFAGSAAKTAADGSSPLARGLLAGLVGGLGIPGIIPARAGFTRGIFAPPVTKRDHPRSRGVYERGRILADRTVGSSPLARGLHLRILGIPTMAYPIRPLLPSLVT